MKKNFMTLIAIVSFSTIAYSQVGINTETPKATLDVVASPDDTTKIDGVIAPRLTGEKLQSKNSLYTSAQEGVIIYATSASPKAGNPDDKTINVDAPGYYYFDGVVWQSFKGEGSGDTEDTSIYKNNGTLASDRTVNLNGNKLVFTGDGNVGIGTASPISKLNVRGGTLNIGNLTEYAGGLQVKNHDASKPVFTAYGTDNVEKMRIANNGNIGVGTTSPTQKLDVNGNVRFRSVTESTSIASTDRVMLLASDGTAKKVKVNNLNKIGDVKYSFRQGDHDGWFLLDGRSISSLPTINQSAAHSIFSTTNLPDARQKVLKKKGALGSTGGSTSTSVTIKRANLPKVTLSGTTSSNGNHKHTLIPSENMLYARGTSARVAYDNAGVSNVYGFPDAQYANQMFTGTNTTGAHTHTVSVQLNNAASQSPLSINTEDPYLSVNVFVYLGQ